MRVDEALQKAREMMTSKRYRLGEVFMHGQLVTDATAGNADLAEAMLEALDACVPDGNFGFWADGGRWAPEGDDMVPVYFYDRTDAQIAGVIGKAMMRASRSAS